MSSELARLLEVHRQSILSFFKKKIPDMDVAEDLTQEVLLRIHKSWAGFDPARGEFVAWALAIARNVLNDYFKKSNRPIEQTQEYLESASESAPAANQLEEKFIQREILDAIERLPEPEKTVLSNRELKGMKLADTATELNLSVRTVSRKLLSAYDLLREDLGSRGISPGAIDG